MRVTLIYCAVGVARFNSNRGKCDREGGWIGHGIASIGASVKAAGHDVDLIDLRQLSGWDELGDILEQNPANIYGLSVAPVDYYCALKTVFEIKSRFPQSRVIIGGIHPSIFPDKYNLQAIDSVVIGEGEITFVDLLRTVEQGEMLPKMVRGVKPNLDKIPWVDRELFDYHRELDCYFAPGQDLPSITMIAGRGCPYRCNYCQPAENAVFGKPHRMRSPGDVLAELSFLMDRYNFKSITFWDDTFTFNRKWVMEFCDQYERAGFVQEIAACSRADIICNNEDMIKRLSRIGVTWLVVGMETGSQRLLNLIEKGTTLKQNQDAVEICHQHGIKVFGTFMYGLPTETPEESIATRALIETTKVDIASPFWYVPIPGTKLHDYCQSHDLIMDGVIEQGIERTGRFMPTLKGVDYGVIRSLMPKCQPL